MQNVIPGELVEKYFNTICSYLKNKRSRVPYQLSKEWCATLPKEAGVYCFFIDDELRYVGETGYIKKRMKDLLDSRNHTLRRAIGENFFSTEGGYAKATSSIKFPDHIERLVEEWMTKHLKVSLLSIPIGRKEFEEWLQDKYPKVEFLNKRKKRK
ncbi:MAG: hypothetical protein KGM16_13655 [Bacteroidota bacterium]|nr:hypothetical protein [Bacteroidota bacterium]